MFFIMGINQGQKELAHNQLIICDHCGAYGRFQICMTYMYLSLFFIPIFKWNKRFLVKTTCCGTVYELNPEVGKAIARGEEVTIKPEDLTVIQTSSRGHYKRCTACGYETQEDFEFCPKCGNRF